MAKQDITDIRNSELAAELKKTAVEFTTLLNECKKRGIFVTAKISMGSPTSKTVSTQSPLILGIEVTEAKYVEIL